MNNILNVRVKKLIKDNLLEYAKHFGGFLAVILILATVFSMINIEVVIGSAYVEGFEYVASEITNFLNGTSSFASFNFFGFIIIMLIAGIVAGAELSMYVRQGIARNEYFKATLIGAIIVSVTLIPFASIANRLINLITGSESVIYSLRNGNLLTIAIHILSFIVFFLGGYLISMTYQRFGWFLGIIITIFALLITGVVSWNFGFWNSEVIIILPIEAFFTAGEHNGLVGLVAPELLGSILVTVSVILASGIYALVKNTPVKIK